ncbi:MAG: PAS domain S-box protein [Candidatus Methanoperedens sp.]|nr:PAS domain S-box protein [Candidatus Methanoperedens sp.]
MKNVNDCREFQQIMLHALKRKVVMSELKEKYKILIIVFLLAIASFITYYFLGVLRIANVFTHFFYIPIILAALWWKRKGMVVAIFLATLLLLSNIFIKNETPTYDDGLRAFMFMVIAFLVVLLSEKIDKVNEELRKHQEHLEDMVNERTAELRNTNKQFQQEITKSKMADEKLREVSLYTRGLIEASLDPLVTISKAGKIMDVNEATELVTGVPRDQIIGSDFSDYFTEAEKAREGYRQVFSKRFVRNYPLAIKHTSGKVTEVLYNAHVYKNIAGEVQGVFASARDITEHKRSMQMLAESEEKFRTLFDNAIDGIMLADVETKKQYMANKKICNMLGYSSEEILNLSVMDLHPEKDIPWIIELFEKQAKGENSFVENIPVKRKNGSVFYADINTSTMIIAGKLYNMGLFRDVTERRQNEEMHRENERLELANRTKNDFLSVMSHELRTPLNAIMGFSELLKNKSAGELNEKQQRYAGNVYSSGKHLLGIIDDVLDLTNAESGNMEIIIEKMSVPNAINKIVDVTKEKAASHKIIIKKQIVPDIEFIETDPNRFRQVLNNLLDNAVKFSKPEGGTVTITAEKEGDMVKFKVSDNGIGIIDKDMRRIFQSFEQLESGIARRYEGTGLGLAISKKLVELIGGSITAESRYGVGSTFTFTLPIKAKNKNI